jgi:hypothetical protein
MSKEFLKSEKITNLIWFFKNISSEIFVLSLISYLALFLLEEIKTGFVSNFINMNYILVLVIVTGTITALSKPSKISHSERRPRLVGAEVEESPRHPEPEPVEGEGSPQKLTWKDYLLIFTLGIIAFVVVFSKIREIGLWLSLAISILSAILIVLISILFLREVD